MKILNKGIYISILILVLIGTTLFVRAQESQNSSIRVTGATTIQPFVEKLSELYTLETGVRISVAGGGSGRGISDVSSGESDVGMVSRALTQEEKQVVSYATVGFDALVFIVNESNPMSAIDLDTVVKVFRGEYKNWSEIANFSEDIVLISKERGRATLDLFEGYSGLKHPMSTETGRNGKITPKSFEIASNLEGVTLVGGILGGIGYVSLGSAQALIEMGMPIKILDLDGVKSILANVSNGTYPILRELNLTYQISNHRAKSFVEFALSRVGQRIISEEGFVPVEGGR